MSVQWTLPVGFRNFERLDYDRLAELYNSIFPDYSRTAQEWQHWDEMLDRSRYYFNRLACLKRETDEVIGFGQCQHAVEMYHPKKFWLEIWVDPKHQRKGVGDSIYKRLSQELAEKGAVTCWAGVREDMMEPMKFATRRGFREMRRTWESRIDPSKFDGSRFKQYAEKVSRQGIVISSLSEEKKRDPECYRKLHELVNKISADMPRPVEFTPIPYNQWVAMELEHPDLTPDGYMIARDADNYVGLSALWRSQTEPRGLYQGNTGVLKEFRGRGIAVALKLRVLDFARRGGYEKVKTWNDSENAAMLGINMKLGFHRQVGWIVFQKDLA